MSELLYVLCNCLRGASKRITVIGNSCDEATFDKGLPDLFKANVVSDSNTIFLYPGNNIPASRGTAVPQREAGLISNTDAQAFFVPGYRDLASGGKEGYQSVKDEQRYLENLRNKNIRFYPGKSCSGPKQIDPGNNAMILIMNSQW